MRDLFSYTGNSKIIIRDFLTKKILAEMDEASYTFNFSNNSIAAAKSITNRLASFDEFAPNSIELSGIILTKDLLEILYANKKPSYEKAVFPQYEFSSTNDNGEIFLNNIPSDNNIQIKKIQDSSYSFVNKEDIDLETGIIKGLEPSKNYNILYYISTDNFVGYQFQTHRVGYVSIDIINTGNNNGIGSKMYIKVPKASISLKDGFSFEKISVAQSAIEFKIIDHTVDVYYY